MGAIDLLRAFAETYGLKFRVGAEEGRLFVYQNMQPPANVEISKSENVNLCFLRGHRKVVLWRLRWLTRLRRTNTLKAFRLRGLFEIDDSGGPFTQPRSPVGLFVACYQPISVDYFCACTGSTVSFTPAARASFSTVS